MKHSEGSRPRVCEIVIPENLYGNSKESYNYDSNTINAVAATPDMTKVTESNTGVIIQATPQIYSEDEQTPVNLYKNAILDATTIKQRL